jgi:hypothetical protein
MTDDFYIGYQARMASGLARRIRVATAILLAVAVLLPLVLVAAQRRSAPGVFEFGRVRVIEGHLVEFPYPALDADDPEQASYWLVAPGKLGASGLVRGLDGRRVRVRGTLIERDGMKMLQMVPNEIETLSPGAETRPSASLRMGPLRVAGELVDSKCHLGVMKPGEGPLHRDCAVRCLLGAVPPMLVEHGTGRRFALIHHDGRPFVSDFSALAGRPLMVRGTLMSQGPRRFLAVGLDDIEVDR